MLAGMRSCFPLSFWLAFSVAVCLPVQSQINGVPPRSLHSVSAEVTTPLLESAPA
jgi:hypothetical protein